MRRAWRHGIGWAGIVIALVVVGARDGETRMTIRSQARLSFHAQYWDAPFDPADDFGFEIWTCASGVMPTFVALSDPVIECRDETGTAPTPADLAYVVEIPGGSCVDHGQVCYLRNPDSAVRDGGVRFFKVQYAKRDHGNKIWLESVGDLSAADQANMLVLVAIDGKPRASLQGTFVPLGARGWAAEF